MTRTIKRGSRQLFQYLATVMSSLIPFICIAPSPTSAIAQILSYVTENPGLSQNKVMQGIGLTSQSKAGPAFSALKSTGKIHTVPGSNKSQLHYPGPAPEAPDDPSAGVFEP